MMPGIEDIQKMLADQLGQGAEAKASSSGPQIPAMKLTPTGPHPDEGKLLEIHGVAENAMAGAVVVTDDGASYHVEEPSGLIEAWDDATAGTRIVVTGTMVRKKLAPDPTIDADGNVSHGMMGQSSVLTNASWRPE